MSLMKTKNRSILVSSAIAADLICTLLRFANHCNVRNVCLRARKNTSGLIDALAAKFPTKYNVCLLQKLSFANTVIEKNVLGMFTVLPALKATNYILTYESYSVLRSICVHKMPMNGSNCNITYVTPCNSRPFNIWAPLEV
jgi:hypothetical protein